MRNSHTLYQEVISATVHTVRNAVYCYVSASSGLSSEGETMTQELDQHSLCPMCERCCRSIALKLVVA